MNDKFNCIGYVLMLMLLLEAILEGLMGMKILPSGGIFSILAVIIAIINIAIVLGVRFYKGE